MLENRPITYYHIGFCLVLDAGTLFEKNLGLQSGRHIQEFITKPRKSEDKLRILTDSGHLTVTSVREVQNPPQGLLNLIVNLAGCRPYKVGRWVSNKIPKPDTVSKLLAQHHTCFGCGAVAREGRITSASC